MNRRVLFLIALNALAFVAEAAVLPPTGPTGQAPPPPAPTPTGAQQPAPTPPPATGTGAPVQTAPQSGTNQQPTFQPLSSFADLLDVVNNDFMRMYDNTRVPTNNLINGLASFVTEPLGGLLAPFGMQRLPADLTSVGVAGLQQGIDTGMRLGYTAVGGLENGMRAGARAFAPLGQIAPALGRLTSGAANTAFGLPSFLGNVASSFIPSYQQPQAQQNQQFGGQAQQYGNQGQFPQYGNQGQFPQAGPFGF